LINCEECGTPLSDDTKKVADPYLEEIVERTEMKYLCDKCYRNALDEI